MTDDADVKRAVYGLFTETGRAPTVEQVARAVRADVDFVRAAYLVLEGQRALVLEDDGATIHMANPFSGRETQHVVEAAGVSYFANCAWDTMGILAALDLDGVIRSRCEQSGEAFELVVGPRGPEPSDWVYHCAVPAARWWDDIVHT